MPDTSGLRINAVRGDAAPQLGRAIGITISLGDVVLDQRHDIRCCPPCLAVLYLNLGVIDSPAPVLGRRIYSPQSVRRLLVYGQSS